VDTIEHTQGKRSRFPRSRLRLPNEIPGWIREYAWQGFLLNRGGSVKAHGVNGFEEIFGEIEFIKGFDRTQV
jgi:hypothetical protein